MYSVFNPQTSATLADRIESLSTDHQAQWGKMSPWQMVRHCIKSERMFQGEKAYKRTFVGRLFGKMALKGILKDESPMDRNQPTHPEFKITGDGDLTVAKETWHDLVRSYASLPAESFVDFVHPFFGKMTYDEIGKYVYKHTDHHLRQFGV